MLVALPSSLLLPPLLLLWLFIFPGDPLGRRSCSQFTVASCQLPVHSWHFHFVFVASAIAAAAAALTAPCTSCLLLIPPTSTLLSALSFGVRLSVSVAAARRRCFCSGFMTFFCQRTPCHLTHTLAHTLVHTHACGRLCFSTTATPFPCAVRARLSLYLYLPVVTVTAALFSLSFGFSVAFAFAFRSCRCADCAAATAQPRPCLGIGIGIGLGLGLCLGFGLGLGGSH